jgi:hypothetical protein
MAYGGQRKSWRREKTMIVLKLWSDEYRRRSVDVFVYKPFNFCKWIPESEMAFLGG